MINEFYAPQELEPQIQSHWETQKTFEATEDKTREKFYCLTMFPYPSGYLHMGHTRVYTITDMIARYHRMHGKNVMQPMGWDAFGLPAENAAIERGVPPAEWTYKNIAHMKAQFKRLGFAYDWSREIATCKPEYYRFEQWLFIQMFNRGLAYKKDAVVNWDPVDQTVLANEQVIDGRGWRSGALIERREISQWFLKITDYAEELLADLDLLTGWPEAVRVMQRNWIGKSYGVEIIFNVPHENKPLQVYTTRPDTLMGVTFLAIAAEHPLAKKVAGKRTDVQNFIETCKHVKVAEADLATLEKTGMDLGLFATHPITQEKIPIWVTNYVLMDYGFGAVMAVPAHDERDHEFAKKYALPIKPVIKPVDANPVDTQTKAFTDKGVLINSGIFEGLSSEEAFDKIADHLKSKSLGKKQVNFRIRDWGISRQRYWGTPIPIVYCEYCGAVPVDEKDLPVVLPENVKFSGATSPLPSMPEFYETTCPKCHQKARRETDTFDTFMESSWYYARYACPDQKDRMFDERVDYWLPVDQYIGGIEHAVMHLLYARFIHKVLRDLGLLKPKEPFEKLLTQGMVLKDGSKMSKSKGNTVDPQALIDQFGADTVRFFCIFASPPEQSLEWSDTGVEGSYRFLKRVWALAYTHQEMIKTINKKPVKIEGQKLSTEEKNKRREIYLSLKQAESDLLRQQLNTVASATMKIANTLQDLANLPTTTQTAALLHEGMQILLSVLYTITPHITAHLWNALGYQTPIEETPWPAINNDALQADTEEIVIQLNGKKRTQIEAPANLSKTELENIVLAHEKIKPYCEGKTIKKIIVVPHKLVNIVVGE